MTKPIIATNIDGITEQITYGVNGILVPPKDPSVLAKVVIRVLNDKELARTMGLAARKKVEQEFAVDRLAPHKPRPLRRGQGELYKNVYLPYRAAKHCRQAEPRPFKAGSFKKWSQKQKRSICLSGKKNW